MLCEGEVKLSVSSSEGKRLILRIAKAGGVLGLMSALSNKPMEVTAETMRPCQIAFIKRDDFVRFLMKHPQGLQRSGQPVSLTLSDCLRATPNRGPFHIRAGKARQAAAGVRWREGHEERVVRHILVSA